MDIQATLMEKIKRFEDLKTQIGELSKKIGALTEQQRAIYNQGLEMKGQIDVLLELQKKEEDALAGSKTAGLTLPVGVKPVVAETSAPVVEGSVVSTAPAATTEAAKQPVTLEVK